MTTDFRKAHDALNEAIDRLPTEMRDKIEAALKVLNDADKSERRRATTLADDLRRGACGHELPAPENGTLPQAINEIAALSDWAKRQRLDNIYYRLNWVLRVVAKHEVGDAPAGQSSERNRAIRDARISGRTLEDIGGEFGISKQRVEQICKTDE